MNSTSTTVPDVVIHTYIGVPARDGITLRCTLARPAGEGGWPVIVVRTPCGKDAPSMSPVLDPVGLARDGFAVVLQDVRGRFASGGDRDFVPFVRDGLDGEDLIVWAAAQPFSTGDVFALGAYYQVSPNGRQPCVAPPPSVRSRRISRRVCPGARAAAYRHAADRCDCAALHGPSGGGAAAGWLP